MFDGQYDDITLVCLVSIKKIRDECKSYNHLVGRDMFLNHDELSFSETNGKGFRLNLFNSNVSLIINGITMVDYSYGESHGENIVDSVITIENEYYRYTFIEYDVV